MSDLELYRRGKIWHVRGTIKVPGQKKGIRVRESTGHAGLADAKAYRDKLRADTLEKITNGPAATSTFATAVIIYLEKNKDSGEKGVQNFDDALLNLYKAGTITLEEAMSHADSRSNLEAKINFG